MDDLRLFFANSVLPATLTPRPHLHIIDVQKFVDTQLARLDCESKILQRLAVANLTALKNILESLTNKTT
jgi:hypothetical protein